MSHVEFGRSLTGGYFRPSRSTIGVASAQTAQESINVAKRRVHECCILSARITSTYWTALNSAMPNQINAIHSQRGGFELWDVGFMLRSYSRFSPSGTNLP